MQNKPPYYWPDEHVAIVRELMQKYPKGTAFNLSQAKYSEPEKLKILTDAGRSIGSIYGKARYLSGATSKQQTVKRKKAPTTPVQVAHAEAKPSVSQGWNYCPNCGYQIAH